MTVALLPDKDNGYVDQGDLEALDAELQRIIKEREQGAVPGEQKKRRPTVKRKRNTSKRRGAKLRSDNGGEAVLAREPEIPGN